MTLKEWMNLKALQILELITYIANIAKKVAFWNQATKKKLTIRQKRRKAKMGNKLYSLLPWQDVKFQERPWLYRRRNE